MAGGLPLEAVGRIFPASRQSDGAAPDFLSRLVALANFLRLSLLKAAHVEVGERSVAGNPGPHVCESPHADPAMLPISQA
jgi:hypothetical protein